MELSGTLNLRISANLASYHLQPSRASSLSSEVFFPGCTNSRSNPSEISQKCLAIKINTQTRRSQTKVFARKTGEYNLFSSSLTQEIETFLMNAINMSFMDRLAIAWKIVFPSPTTVKKSNARIAKQRLKMILFSDRCAVSDEAKRKIVNNIVRALSDFVEIESQDKVQLNVSTDSDLGTIYSVTVPVRRVKPEYQDLDEAGSITNVEYKDTDDGSVDVKFDFYIPD